MIVLTEHEIYRQIHTIEKSADSPFVKVRKLLSIGRPLKFQLDSLKRRRTKAAQQETKDVLLRLERLEKHLQEILKSLHLAARRTLPKKNKVQFETVSSYGGPIFSPIKDI